MAKAQTRKSKQSKVPQVAGFDRGVKDFFRGSRGGVGVNVPTSRSFIGMRRGSR